MNKALNRHFTLEGIWIYIFARKYAQYHQELEKCRLIQMR